MLQEASVLTVISPRSVLRLFPLYCATSVSPVDKSTCTCSNTFFFGCNWASGSVSVNKDKYVYKMLNNTEKDHTFLTTAKSTFLNIYNYAWKHKYNSSITS